MKPDHVIKKDYQGSFKVPEKFTFKTKKGLSEEIIKAISFHKKEPQWMLEFRLKSFELFKSKPLPPWGADLSNINFDEIYYYIKSSDRSENNWDNVPEEIKTTFDRLGIPDAEQKYLGGVGAQYESEVVYHSLQKHLGEKGVIFTDMDTALQKYPDLFKEYFSTVVPPDDNKFAALNSSVWSGGSFVYIPKGVRVELPLQAYFRINAERMGQFERTLIIADEGSFVHYVEGCTAPKNSTDLLHNAVVEVIVKAGARVVYTTIQNWSKNVYNLVTKRSFVYRDGTMEWVDGNLGSQVTMKYPSIYLLEPGARGEILSLAFAGKGQHQDAGGKVIHVAPHTSSRIISKSTSQDSGRTSYRGWLKVFPEAFDVKSHVTCDALILDEKSRSDTYPTMDIRNPEASIEHEATVSKISEEQLFYLMSRGIPEGDARGLIVNGFFEPIIKELPMEYALELNRFIGLEMDGSVG